MLSRRQVARCSSRGGGAVKINPRNFLNPKTSSTAAGKSLFSAGLTNGGDRVASSTANSSAADIQQVDVVAKKSVQRGGRFSSTQNRASSGSESQHLRARSTVGGDGYVDKDDPNHRDSDREAEVFDDGFSVAPSQSPLVLKISKSVLHNPQSVSIVSSVEEDCVRRNARKRRPSPSAIAPKTAKNSASLTAVTSHKNGDANAADAVLEGGSRKSKSRKTADRLYFADSEDEDVIHAKRKSTAKTVCAKGREVEAVTGDDALIDDDDFRKNERELDAVLPNNAPSAVAYDADSVEAPTTSARTNSRLLATMPAPVSKAAVPVDAATAQNSSSSGTRTPRTNLRVSWKQDKARVQSGPTRKRFKVKAANLCNKLLLFVSPREADASTAENGTTSNVGKVIYKADEFAFHEKDLPSKFTRNISESDMAADNMPTELPIQHISDGVSVLPPSDGEVSASAVKKAAKRLRSIKQEMPIRRSSRVAAITEPVPTTPTKSVGKSLKRNSSSYRTNTSFSSTASQQSEQLSEQSERQKMMSVPPHPDEMWTPEKYLHLGNVVWGPSSGEFPPWPVVITRIDIERPKKKSQRKKNRFPVSPSKLDDADVPIRKKLFHYVYLEPDFAKFRKRASWKKPFTAFKRYYPKHQLSTEEQLHINAQMSYFRQVMDTVRKNNLPLLYNTALQMADLYHEKKHSLLGISVDTGLPTVVPSLETLLCAIETICWIGYMVFCQYDFAYLQISDVPETVKNGFLLLKITRYDIWQHFKKDVDELHHGDKLPCIDKPIPPIVPSNTNTTESAVESTTENDGEAEVKEEDISDAASDATVAEYRQHRFCIAPWLLPAELGTPDDVEDYENDIEINELHDKFVDDVIEICKKPETEQFLRRRLDMKDVNDPNMYWRLKAFLTEGPRSQQLRDNGFLLPINNQDQRTEWDDFIDDWFITYYRDCHVTRITECENDTEKKLLVDLAVVPLLWVYAVSQIRNCSLDDAEKLVSKMLD